MFVFFTTNLSEEETVIENVCICVCVRVCRHEFIIHRIYTVYTLYIKHILGGTLDLL